MVAQEQLKQSECPDLIHTNQARTINETLKTAEHSETSTFKALIRETSVYKYIIELKEDVFTEQGFLDLAKVPGLYVTGAGQFLKKLRLKNSLSRTYTAKIAGISRETVRLWELNTGRIPLKSLVKIAEICDLSRDTVYSHFDQGKFYLRRVKLPVKFEQIREIIQYLSPRKYEIKHARITLHKHCPENLTKVLHSLNINPRIYGSDQVIQSRELFNYLTTFFRYTKVPKLRPPLTTEVKGWYDDGIDLKRTVIIPSLQSDGNTNINKGFKVLVFCGNNKVLHNYFVDALYYEYHELPTSYFIKDSGSFVTIYYKKSTNQIVDEVMNLAGNTKTNPANGQSVDEYLQESQPHLDYLINASKKEQQIALRIWASTEGCVSIHKRKKWIYPTVIIACTHPILAKQLKQLAKKHGIRFTITHDISKWSKIDRLYNRSIRGCINFLKLGSFIKGVKISSHSPYHENIPKDVLTLGILEYLRQRKINKHSEKVPLELHHHNINKIISDREYKSVDYYINYFS